MQIDAGTPDGFAQLAAPRPTRVTLFYGGGQLGSFAAHFTPDSLRFDRPGDIVAAVPAIADPARVTDALRATLPAHADLVCGPRRVEDCGNLTPAIAAVIFNASQLSAELFINPALLTVSPAATDRYLPLPDRHLASVLGFDGALTGTDARTPLFSLSNDATASLGEGRLAAQSTVSNQGLRFDSATAGIERQGWAETAGLFRSRSMQLLSDRDIAGLSVTTSTRTLLDQYKTSGNDILLYLPRRSFVSILREGRLYSSRAYEAGNQHIATEELPEGAYDITLRIQEPDGATREERRFFVKTQQLPPPDDPAWYLQAGMIRKLAADDATVPQLTGDPLLRIGTVRRLTDELGLSVGALGLKDRGLVESGLFWLAAGAQVTATALTSSRGDLGVQAGYVQTTGRITFAMDARDIWLSHAPLPGFDDMAGHILQGTAALGFALTPATSFGFRGSYASQSGTPVTTSVGPYAEWRIWQHGESLLGLTADAARTAGQVQGNLLLHFSQRLGQWGVTGSGGAAAGGGGTGPIGNARIWHEDTTPGNSVLAGAGFSGDRRSQTASADADWHNGIGQLRGSAQESIGPNGPTFGYGGTFAVNAAALADEVHVGGEQTDGSAVIVTVDGTGADRLAAMKIVVNGIERSSVAIGGQRVLYLTPFHVYRIRIVPAQPGLLDYDAAERSVTLYPGNVVRQNWRVAPFFVVAAKLVDADGRPVADARLDNNARAVTTDARGRLQAELSGTAPLTLTSGDRRCRAELPAQQPVNGVLVLKDPLVCREI